MARMTNQTSQFAQIPMQSVGPFKLIGDVTVDDLMVPMATYETPLWPSVARGARTTAHAGGIRVTLVDERMTRSILLQAPHAGEALRCLQALKARQDEMQAQVSQSSRFAKLIDIHSQIIGNLIYLRQIGRAHV